MSTSADSLQADNVANPITVYDLVDFTLAPNPVDKGSALIDYAKTHQQVLGNGDVNNLLEPVNVDRVAVHWENPDNPILLDAIVDTIPENNLYGNLEEQAEIQASNIARDVLLTAQQMLGLQNYAGAAHLLGRQLTDLELRTGVLGKGAYAQAKFGMGTFRNQFNTQDMNHKIWEQLIKLQEKANEQKAMDEKKAKEEKEKANALETANQARIQLAANELAKIELWNKLADSYGFDRERFILFNRGLLSKEELTKGLAPQPTPSTQNMIKVLDGIEEEEKKSTAMVDISPAEEKFQDTYLQEAERKKQEEQKFMDQHEKEMYNRQLLLIRAARKDAEDAEQHLKAAKRQREKEIRQYRKDHPRRKDQSKEDYQAKERDFIRQLDEIFEKRIAPLQLLFDAAKKRLQEAQKHRVQRDIDEGKMDTRPDKEEDEYKGELAKVILKPPSLEGTGMDLEGDIKKDPLPMPTEPTPPVGVSGAHGRQLMEGLHGSRPMEEDLTGLVRSEFPGPLPDDDSMQTEEEKKESDTLKKSVQDAPPAGPEDEYVVDHRHYLLKVPNIDNQPHTETEGDDPINIDPTTRNQTLKNPLEQKEMPLDYERAPDESLSDALKGMSSKRKSQADSVLETARKIIAPSSAPDAVSQIRPTQNPNITTVYDDLVPRPSNPPDNDTGFMHEPGKSQLTVFQGMDEQGNQLIPKRVPLENKKYQAVTPGFFDPPVLTEGERGDGKQPEPADYDLMDIEHEIDRSERFMDLSDDPATKDTYRVHLRRLYVERREHIARRNAKGHGLPHPLQGRALQKVQRGEWEAGNDNAFVDTEFDNDHTFKDRFAGHGFKLGSGLGTLFDGSTFRHHSGGYMETQGNQCKRYKRNPY